MGFEDPASARPIPLSADRRFRLDESAPAAKVIDYLREENRVLREQLDDRQLRLDDLENS